MCETATTTPRLRVDGELDGHCRRSRRLESVIELSGVTKRYGNSEALSDVSLRIQKGVTGLLGPNGSGKSTLIKSLLGRLRTQNGSGSVLGHLWPQQVRIIRDQVGYLPEDDCYIAGLTGIESQSLELDSQREAIKVLNSVGPQRSMSMA